MCLKLTGERGSRLLVNTDVPPYPHALLGTRAHKLDKKSNFPWGSSALSACRHTVSLQGGLICILRDGNGLIKGQLELDCGLLAESLWTSSTLSVMPGL